MSRGDQHAGLALESVEEWVCHIYDVKLPRAQKINKYSGNNDMLSSLKYFWLYAPKVICNVEFGVTKGFAKTVTPSHPYC